MSTAICIQICKFELSINERSVMWKSIHHQEIKKYYYWLGHSMSSGVMKLDAFSSLANYVRKQAKWVYFYDVMGSPSFNIKGCLSDGWNISFQDSDTEHTSSQARLITTPGKEAISVPKKRIFQSTLNLKLTLKLRIYVKRIINLSIWTRER